MGNRGGGVRLDGEGLGEIYALTRPKNTPPGPTLPSMSFERTPTTTPPLPDPSSSAATLRSSEPAASPDFGSDTLARRQLTRPCIVRQCRARHDLGKEKEIFTVCGIGALGSSSTSDPAKTS
jgi:hypothetical protein